MSQPNVIIFTCHDLGDEISPYGVPVRTPNLERMAAEGALMENHFSTASICSPARGSILSGCYPHTNGLMGPAHRGWELDGSPPATRWWISRRAASMPASAPASSWRPTWWPCA